MSNNRIRAIQRIVDQDLVLHKFGYELIKQCLISSVNVYNSKIEDIRDINIRYIYGSVNKNPNHLARFIYRSHNRLKPRIEFHIPKIYYSLLRNNNIDANQIYTLEDKRSEFVRKYLITLLFHEIRHYQQYKYFKANNLSFRVYAENLWKYVPYDKQIPEIDANLFANTKHVFDFTLLARNHLRLKIHDYHVKIKKGEITYDQECKKTIRMIFSLRKKFKYFKKDNGI